MVRYLELAEQLHTLVVEFMNAPGKDAIQLGHIINLAVRCNPRQSQGTVRKNIVATAMRGYCDVTMTRETEAGRSYNKISIK